MSENTESGQVSIPLQRELEALGMVAIDQASLLEKIKYLTEKNSRMINALVKIANWHGEFPETGKFNEQGEKLSYGYCYGSNGERDYMRKVANEALIETK